ncbi:hypothetical protein [Pseudodesulfovibrio sp.]|uniref:hypothetical protein n=1 Tax=unclassified Pseudodesulfovibrio TaxID=2661612 RepID=UPI003B00E481
MKTLKIEETDFPAIQLGAEEIAKVREVHPKAVELLMGLRSVVGIGIGHKWKGGVARKEACLHVFVEQKRPLEALPDSERVPPRIGDVGTDVIEVGKVLLEAMNDKVRPLQSGTSIGAAHGDKATGGTLGAFVKGTGKLESHYYLLSNNHVLALNNAFPVGSLCYQPSVPEGGGAGEICAELSDFVPLDSDGANLVDAAIAQVDEKLIAPERPYASDPVPATELKIGTEVMKEGFTSGLTFGVILTSDVTIKVQSASGDSYNMVEQYACSYTSLAGDSGALVMRREDERAVGLHFAGGTGIAYMSSIERVLEALQVELY